MPVATSSSDSSKWLGLAMTRAFVCVCVSARKTDIKREKREEILNGSRLFQHSGHVSHLPSSNVN